MAGVIVVDVIVSVMTGPGPAHPVSHHYYLSPEAANILTRPIHDTISFTNIDQETSIMKIISKVNNVYTSFSSCLLVMTSFVNFGKIWFLKVSINAAK